MIHKNVEHGKWNRPRNVLGALFVVGVLVGVSLAVAGKDSPLTRVLGASVSTPPAPTITSGPSAPTAATTATFTYTDSQNGVGFQCKLDGAAFTSCAKSGVMYTGLAVGSHTFQVKAQSGNGPLSGADTRTWSVVVPPASPTITQRPLASTADPEATFGFTTTQAGVTFECKLDGASFAPCISTKTYTDITVGSHVFQVRAVDASGIASAPVSFSWTVVTGSFGISGNLAATLAPGVSSPLNLSFTNPYNFSGGLKVLSVTVTVQQGTVKDGHANPACIGPDNIAVAQATFAPPPAAPPTVPRNSTKSLSDLGVPSTQWPQISMLNQPWNQDACKGTTFNFSYTGTATK